MRQFTVYTIPNCPWCSMVKDRLKYYAEQFYEENLDTPEKLREWAKRYPGLKTMPQVFMHDQGGDTIHVGGYTETVEFLTRSEPQ